MVKCLLCLRWHSLSPFSPAQSAVSDVRLLPYRGTRPPLGALRARQRPRSWSSHRTNSSQCPSFAQVRHKPGEDSAEGTPANSTAFLSGKPAKPSHNHSGPLEVTHDDRHSSGCLAPSGSHKSQRQVLPGKSATIAIALQAATPLDGTGRASLVEPGLGTSPFGSSLGIVGAFVNLMRECVERSLPQLKVLLWACAGSIAFFSMASLQSRCNRSAAFEVSVRQPLAQGRSCEQRVCNCGSGLVQSAPTNP